MTNDSTGENTNRQVSFINSKRNPISEGPNTIIHKRGNPMERHDMHVQNRRPRILSSDVTLIDNTKIEKASKYRRSAQNFYKNGDYFDALTQLQKAVRVFKVDHLSKELKQFNEKAFNLIKDCFLFTASCYININQFDNAIQLMSEVLQVEENDTKALYLRGKAYIQKGELLLAYKDF